MKRLEKWAESNMTFLLILLSSLIASVWIYQYRIERNAILGIENVSIGCELFILAAPVIYLSLTWKEWAN